MTSWRSQPNLAAPAPVAPPPGLTPPLAMNVLHAHAPEGNAKSKMGCDAATQLCFQSSSAVQGAPRVMMRTSANATKMTLQKTYLRVR